jgi:hypothetical protein
VNVEDKYFVHRNKDGKQELRILVSRPQIRPWEKPPE